MVFSDTYISEYDAETLLAKSTGSGGSTTDSTELDSTSAQDEHEHAGPYSAGQAKEEYETLWLHDQQYLCTIPIVEAPIRNETSEAEARVAEQNELARATDRGWELLQGLDGTCLYYISGWWSYAFCYNKDIVQFHPLTPAPGKSAYPPQRDPNTAEYVLGRAKIDGKGGAEDDYGNEVEVRNQQDVLTPPRTEIQSKGDTRYLVQRLDGGTTCDLTGKPRKVEVQFHCSPQAQDRIGWIKEVTTCSYVMVVHTPRLCNDVAFLPPKEVKANTIACRMVVPEDEVSYWTDLKTLEAQRMTQDAREEAPVINVGGIIVGGQKWGGKDGIQLPSTNYVPEAPAVEVIAHSPGKAAGGKTQSLSRADLERLDIDPKLVEQLKKELEELAGDKGWKLEVIDMPGDTREIRGIVDGDEDEADDVYVQTSGQDEDQEGSEETYNEEL